jgi:predicted PurR-regulated permease PerM
LYYARDFFLPLLLAVLVTLTFRPLVRWLSRRGIPAVATAILLVVLLGAGIVGLSVVLAGPFATMVANVPVVISELKERFEVLRRPLALLSESGRQLQEFAAGPTPDTTQRVVIAQPGILSWAADTLTGIGTTFGATLVLALFLLASGDLFPHKLIRVLHSLHEAKRSLRIMHAIENEVSRYLLTITVINIGFGCAIGVAMALLGLTNPVLWGAAAALLNFAPYLGAIVGVGTTFAVALITFPTIAMAALPPITYLVIHLVESTFVTPLILGRRLELNAVAILIALAFCGWMWGIVGALIAVPLLVVVKVFCDSFPGLSAFGEFLSGSDIPAPETPANGAAEGARGSSRGAMEAVDRGTAHPPVA